MCRRCGSSHLRPKLSNCLVFSENAVLDSSIDEDVCQACGWEAFDGAEHFVVRKCSFTSALLGQVELCFHYDLLYKTMQELVEGQHWHNKWVRQLEAYRHCGMAVDQLCALSSVYRHFREVCIDFVELQHLNYSQMLVCKCLQRHQHLVADGITIACPLKKLYLAGPWLPQGDEGLLMQHHGSTYHERFAIPDSQMRQHLRELSHSAGLDGAAFASLLQSCDRMERHGLADLLEFLCPQVGGNHKTVQWAQPLVRELGANSPACAIVPASDITLVQRWVTLTKEAVAAPLAARRALLGAWTAEQDLRVRCSMPKLWRPMREVHALAATADVERKVAIVCSLADAFSWLAEVCSMPSYKVCASKLQYVHHGFRVPC